jgi:hypothetical protein
MHLAISQQSEQASANVRSVSGRQKNTAHPNDRLSGHSSVDEIICAYRLPRAKRRTRRLPSEIGLTATSEETRERGRRVRVFRVDSNSSAFGGIADMNS